MDSVNLDQFETREQVVPRHLSNRENQTPSNWRTWLSILLVIGTAGILFGLLAAAVGKKGGFGWDAPIMLAIHQYRTPWLNTLMLWISEYGLPPSRLVLAVGVWLWFRKHRRTAFALVFSDMGSIILGTMVKPVFTRQRPTLITPLEKLHDFSFPSGHTLAAVTLYGMIAYLGWQNRRYLWALVCAIPLLLISLSRVYLGVHYPSDILGAMALGIAWIALVLLLARVVAMHTQQFQQFNIGDVRSSLASPRSRAEKGNSLS